MVLLGVWADLGALLLILATARASAQLSGPPSARWSSTSVSARVKPSCSALLMNRTRGTASAGYIR
jgi:hypothetical protein